MATIPPTLPDTIEPAAPPIETPPQPFPDEGEPMSPDIDAPAPGPEIMPPD